MCLVVFFSLTHELPSQTLYEIRDCNQAEAVRMIEEAAEAIAARGPKWNHGRFNGTRGEPFTVPHWNNHQMITCLYRGFQVKDVKVNDDNQCFSFPELHQSWCSTLSQEPPALTASKGEGFLGVFHMQS